MNIKFWGTRGSISAPGSATVKYGGNTACVEISNSDTLAIFDAGTGIRPLGEALIRRHQGHRIEGHLFISHFHYDHIVGFPFFRPFYGKDNAFNVYGCEGTGRKLENIFVGQMSPEYFPVTLAEMPAQLKFIQLTTRPLTLNAWTITPAYINHPGLALAYKIEDGKNKVVYMTDNEPFRYLLRQQARKTDIFDDLKRGQVELEREDLLLADFFEGADLLIHDGQYTQEEYPSRIGWGHSFYEFAVEMAVQGKVKELLFFHHDPDRTDDELDRCVETARALVRSRGAALKVDAAREGQEVILS